MLSNDLLSKLSQLSRTEKLRVIQYLASNLELEAGASVQSITAATEHEVLSHLYVGGAVATLHKLLGEHDLSNHTN